MATSAAQRNSLPSALIRLATATSTPRFLGLTLILLPAFYVGLVTRDMAYDDAFITFRYAYNLASGWGYVYNPGEWYLGTTAPFYGLLLGLGGAIIGPNAIPAISGVLSSVSLALTGAALFEYGRIHRQLVWGLFAGLFYVIYPLVSANFGGEMLFQVMLISWAFVSYSAGRTIPAALLLALAILTRPDAILAAAVLGLHFAITRRRLPLRELLAAGLVLLPFVLLAWAYYGSPLPSTLNAKVAQGASGLWVSFARGSFEWIRGMTMQGTSTLFPGLPAIPSSIRLYAFAALGVPFVLLWYRQLVLPLSWVALYALGYSLLKVPFYGWYIMPMIWGAVILAAAGVSGVIELAQRILTAIGGAFANGRAVLVLTGLVLLLLAPGFVAQLSYTRDRMRGWPNTSGRIYRQAADWFQAHTEAGDRIGYFEVGVLGYYSRRPIVDLLGLVTPGNAVYLARHDFVSAYAQARPDYIIVNPIFAQFQPDKLTAQGWFREEYHEVAKIAQAGYPAQLTIFARSPAFRGAQ